MHKPLALTLFLHARVQFLLSFANQTDVPTAAKQEGEGSRRTLFPPTPRTGINQEVDTHPPLLTLGGRARHVWTARKLFQ